MTMTSKNPLSQALGIALRKERLRLGLSTDEVARDIGIKASFYNLIENGSNFLHVNKSLMVSEAFKCEISLDGITKILMAISMMEAAAREKLDGHHDKSSDYNQLYFDGLLAAIDKLIEHDEKKLGRLLSVFDLKKFSNLPPKEAAKYIDVNSLDDEVLEFCKNYEIYGNKPTDTKDSYILDRFNSVPSIYFDFITDFLDKLVELPVKVGFEELWRWESINKCEFTDSICFSSNIESVISEDNLRRYHFNHLWEEQFTSAKFIFQTNRDVTELKNDFKEIFHKRLIESTKTNIDHLHTIQNAVNKLRTFEDAMKKIRFKSVSNGEKEIAQNLIQLISDNTAIWYFSFKNNDTVSFLAKISCPTDNPPNKLIEVKSLNFKETKKCFDLLNSLWDSLN